MSRENNGRVVANHLTDGEIGAVHNHYVSHAVGFVPPEIINHGMEDAAPTCAAAINTAVPNQIGEEELAKILGLYRYPGRVLPVTNPGDIVMLHPELQQHWDWIAAHYERVGIKHSGEVIWDDNFELMGEFLNHTPSVFFFGDRANQARPDPAWYQTAQVMNGKNFTMKLAKQLKIRTPATVCFDSPNDFDIQLVERQIERYPVLLKISVSVSGLGVIKCRDRTELEQEVNKLAPELAFQIQQMIEIADECSVQYAANGSLNRLTATDQIISDFIHEGNRVSTPHAPWELTDPLARWMWRQGMKGHFSFDLVVDKNGHYYITECNPRFGGAAYPYYTATKLGVSEWVCLSIKTGHEDFEGIDLGELEYDPHTKKGVVVINWGCITDHKLGVLIAAPTVNEQDMISEKLHKLLN